MNGSPTLSELREAIADVGRALLELLRRRMELAAQVGRAKAATGAPVIVRDLERCDWGPRISTPERRGPILLTFEMHHQRARSLVR